MGCSASQPFKAVDPETKNFPNAEPTIADAATMVCVENKSADSQGLSRQEEGTDELPVLSDMLDSVLDCHSRLCTITEETKDGWSGEVNALGQPHGEGLYRFCNGDQFSGRYENGVPFGVGLVRFHDGSLYKGEVECGRSKTDPVVPHGKGQKRLPFHGGAYDGHFKHGMKDGTGTYIFNCGDTYIGQYRRDMQHGKAKVVFSNGVTYIGQFENGQMHGDGYMQYPDGRLEACRHKHGRPNYWFF
mmetsp:Transcript_23604/g.44960  ORF Transcript_23604/g.44960 Transcript_23604/m.44960 type:complete len:245 (+) Transcript_23604:357-1091(+)